MQRAFECVAYDGRKSDGPGRVYSRCAKCEDGVVKKTLDYYSEEVEL